MISAKCKEQAFVHPTLGDRTTVSWSFKRAKTTHPVSVCHLSAFGIESTGLGDAPFIWTAQRKAFSEAWERTIFGLMQGDPRGEITNSNGIAAGRTTEEAIQRSREELIERHLLLEAWKTKKGWSNHILKSTLGRLTAFHLKRSGWDMDFFLIRSSDKHQVLTVFAFSEIFGFTFDSKYVTNFGDAEVALLGSVARSAVRLAETATNFPEKGDPSSHLLFYQKPDTWQAFEFLFKNESDETAVELTNTAGIVTQVILPPTKFPAVAYSKHPMWPALSWGMQSIGGANPWPHPLA